MALAQSELAGKQSAFTAAESARAEAQRRVDQPPPDTRSVEVQSAQSALSQATGNIAAANEDIVASRSALVAAEASARSAVAQVRTDARAARRDVTQARAELRRATRARANAARLAGLAQARVTILSSPDDTALQNEIVAATQLDLARVNAEANRVAAKAAIQVPADELLFFPTLPLRVDSVRLKRGDTGAGRAMTVSNSELAADSSLSINDAKLVRLGAPVVIEEQDLRITVQGRVSRIADRPGTDRVDPTRVYFEVTPSQAPAKLVGASVRLTIKVESTKGKVLAVPLSAVTVGADGRPRVQVDRGSRSEYVPVVPGLAANGLVEVRPSRAGALEVGDLVVVGVKGSISPGALPGGTTAPGAGGTTPPTPGTGTAPASGTAPSAVTAPVTGTAPSTTTPAP